MKKNNKIIILFIILITAILIYFGLEMIGEASNNKEINNIEINKIVKGFKEKENLDLEFMEENQIQNVYRIPDEVVIFDKVEEKALVYFPTNYDDTKECIKGRDDTIYEYDIKSGEIEEVVVSAGNVYDRSNLCK